MKFVPLVDQVGKRQTVRGRLQSRFFAVRGRVNPARRVAENGPDRLSRSRQRDRRARAKRNTAFRSGEGVLRHIALTPARRYPDAEPTLLIVENEGVLLPGRAFERLNPALREFHRFVLQVRGRVCGPHADPPRRRLLPLPVAYLLI